MEFSIIIPTFRNYNYCKLTIDSIKKNSSFKHEIIVHLNGIDEDTENILIVRKFYLPNQMKILVYVAVLIKLLH